MPASAAAVGFAEAAEENRRQSLGAGSAGSERSARRGARRSSRVPGLVDFRAKLKQLQSREEEERDGIRAGYDDDVELVPWALQAIREGRMYSFFSRMGEFASRTHGLEEAVGPDPREASMLPVDKRQMVLEILEALNDTRAHFRHQLEETVKGHGSLRRQPFPEAPRRPMTDMSNSAASPMSSPRYLRRGSPTQDAALASAAAAAAVRFRPQRQPPLPGSPGQQPFAEDTFSPVLLSK